MSATTVNRASAGARATRTAGGRLGAVAGVAFAILFLAGTAILNIPNGASDQKLSAWWADGANQITAIVSMYSFILAGLCFLAFLVQLRLRLLAAEGGAGAATGLVVASGTVFVAMLFVAAASRGVVGFALKSPGANELLPGPDTLRYIPQTGYAALGAAGLLAAAVAIGACSWLIFRTRVFARWLGWLGVAAAVLIVAANVALVGMIAIPAMLVWALATSAELWRGPR
ncbi:MAG: hypothetical protein QOK36_1037 [Gaiellales bacterium]|nr:hypothetical protein [Gaiellales bacterium]